MRPAMDARDTTRDSGQESDGQLVDRTAAPRDAPDGVHSSFAGAPDAKTPAGDRSSAERDEWAVAGNLASGLERARLALAVGARRVEHAAAEGITYA